MLRLYFPMLPLFDEEVRDTLTVTALCCICRRPPQGLIDPLQLMINATATSVSNAAFTSGPAPRWHAASFCSNMPHHTAICRKTPHD